MAKPEEIYPGRTVDRASGRTTGEKVLFDPDDLTTHGLIVGMTGSGKTALGIVLIGELLKEGVPVLAIDLFFRAQHSMTLWKITSACAGSGKSGS